MEIRMGYGQKWNAWNHVYEPQIKGHEYIKFMYAGSRVSKLIIKKLSSNTING